MSGWEWVGVVGEQSWASGWTTDRWVVVIVGGAQAEDGWLAKEDDEEKS